MTLPEMQDHPIPNVTEPLQYRAIGIVRGIYKPSDQNHFTRGQLIDQEGTEIDAVVLGRVMTLMRRHLALDKPHLWVVYPRCRQPDHLHLQIVGIWEPSTLRKSDIKLANSNDSKSSSKETVIDQLPEGDDYFSIRGEVIFTKPESEELIVKVRQKPRVDGKRSIPFKIPLKGNLPFEMLRNFVSLKVRRIGQKLFVEEYKSMGSLPQVLNKKQIYKKSIVRKKDSKK